MKNLEKYTMHAAKDTAISHCTELSYMMFAELMMVCFFYYLALYIPFLMKHYYMLFAAVCFSVAAMAQKPGLSPLTRKYVKDLRDNPAASGSFLFSKSANGQAVSGALIRVSNAGIAQSGLTSLGIAVGTKAGNIWTVRVPANRIEAFTQLPGISYIQLDEPVKPDMNIVRQTTRTDSVHQGISLTMPYSGKGVVMGIIDFGFDYNHPVFYDTTGTQYRVKRVWELNGTGTPPQGYTYGNEITDTTLIRAQGTDNAAQTHGTCVAGIAAGSGFGSPLNSRFRGIAYESDMVLVGVRRDSIEQQWLQGSFSDFIDGINYIFRYAESVGKPAVVNISWGSQSGPHDGSTLFNEACDNLTGSGRIVVMSAGNDGEEKIHLSKTFTPSDTVMHTFLDFVPNLYKRTWVDVWGQTGKSFCAQATLYKNGVAGNTTGFICIDDQIHQQFLVGDNSTDTCFVEFISSSAEYNGKPRMTLNIYNKAADSIAVSFKGTDGHIELWNEYYYYGYTHRYLSDFSSYGFPWAQTGNSTSTVSDMGSGKHVLLIGAYASKISWRDINNQQRSYGGYAQYGRVVPFSSRGPLTDGRIKPDISAPGLTLATGVSSYSADHTPTGASSSNVLTAYTEPLTNKKYYFAEFIGTSASAPVASGIVALMLQANPSLFPFHVRDILAQSAIQDTYTGTLPQGGDNNWGYGKINAYGAVKLAILKLGTYSFAGKKLDCVMYPNPNNGIFTIDYTSSTQEAVMIEVFDITGRMAASKQVEARSGQNLFSLTFDTLPKGLYVVSIRSTEGKASVKMLVE
jgi:minor extracellular serine protease Vpr